VAATFLAHVVHWHCIFGDDFTHLVDFLVEFVDIIVVFANRGYRLVVLLLQHLLLRSHAFQLLAQRFRSGLQLLSFLYQILKL
jgi:hypothetical protein